jgi:predicted phosphoadenosine phosphosulfate sulfurtransferase
MAMPKVYLDSNVLDAAKERIAWAFDNFDKIIVSFSGGKDSTVMTHLVMEEAIARKRKVALFFLDWECQFNLTIEHVKAIYEMYAEWIIPYWIAVPIRTWNGCSQYEPEWIAWDESKRDLWIREKDTLSITNPKELPFYYDNMMFEEFVPLFAKWHGDNKPCANFIGIRSQESLNRYRAIAKRDQFCFGNKAYTTNVVDECWNIYPIYDWDTLDDWRYYGKTGKPYNKLYDRMHQAGLTVHQMRIDEPFGDTQRKGLWLYQIIEPKTWAKMVCRVSGANSGAMYGNESGNILGNQKISLPDGKTWQGFAETILATMPKTTSEHYKNKIAVYIKWYRERGYPEGIPDSADARLEAARKVPSWRLIVKTLLRNDYWCKGLGFSPTKSSAYNKYLELMRRRRHSWNIFDEGEAE